MVHFTDKVIQVRAEHYNTAVALAALVAQLPPQPPRADVERIVADATLLYALCKA
jgi:hypothetical protein